MDGPGVRQVPEGSGELGKMEETGCEIICGAATTLAVKGDIHRLYKRPLINTMERSSLRASFHSNPIKREKNKILRVLFRVF